MRRASRSARPERRRCRRRSSASDATIASTPRSSATSRRRRSRSCSSRRRRRSSSTAATSAGLRSPQRVDYEGELALVIGRQIKGWPQERWLEALAGVCLRQRRDGARPAEEGRPVRAGQVLRHVLSRRPGDRVRSRPVRSRRSRPASTAPSSSPRARRTSSSRRPFSWPTSRG